MPTALRIHAYCVHAYGIRTLAYTHAVPFQLCPLTLLLYATLCVPIIRCARLLLPRLTTYCLQTYLLLTHHYLLPGRRGVLSVHRTAHRVAEAAGADYAEKGVQ
jgi:hypothetical protein